MQPVWVGDLVRMIRLSLEDDGTIGQTLIAVGPEEYSLRELVEFTARTSGLKRRIVGLPDGLARLQGLLMDFVPGKPFSSDNYRSLQIDNTSVENSLWRFGIQPSALRSRIFREVEKDRSPLGPAPFQGLIQISAHLVVLSLLEVAAEQVIAVIFKFRQPDEFFRVAQRKLRII